MYPRRFPDSWGRNIQHFPLQQRTLTSCNINPAAEFQQLNPHSRFYLLNKRDRLDSVVSPQDDEWDFFKARVRKQWSSSRSPWDHRGAIRLQKKRQPKSLTRVVFTKLRDFASPRAFSTQTSSTEGWSSSELGFIFHGGLLHAQAGTVRTTTAASDLETTAYFLGQLRDYVHLKSSEEGSQGGVELRPCLSFVPIGPT